MRHTILIALASLFFWGFGLPLHADQSATATNTAPQTCEPETEEELFICSLLNQASDAVRDRDADHINTESLRALFRDNFDIPNIVTMASHHRIKLSDGETYDTYVRVIENTVVGVLSKAFASFADATIIFNAKPSGTGYLQISGKITSHKEGDYKDKPLDIVWRLNCRRNSDGKNRCKITDINIMSVGLLDRLPPP